MSYCQVIITFCLMQSMEKEFHPKFLEYASEKTRWVFLWVFSSGYEVKKPGGFVRVGWVSSKVANYNVREYATNLLFLRGKFFPFF